MIDRVPKKFTRTIRENMPEFDEYCKKYGNPSTDILKEVVNGTYLSTVKEPTEYDECAYFDLVDGNDEFSTIDDFLTKLRNHIYDQANTRNIDLEKIVKIYPDEYDNTIHVYYKRPENAAEKKERLLLEEGRKVLHSLMGDIKKLYEELYSAEIEKERIRKAEQNKKNLLALERQQKELQKQIDSLKAKG